MKLSSEVLALSLLTAIQAGETFTKQLPSYFEVREWLDDEDLANNVANLRSGYLPALTFGLGLSAAISLVAKSWLPMVFAAGAGAAAIVFYERALPASMRLGGPLELLSLDSGRKKGS